MSIIKIKLRVVAADGDSFNAESVEFPIDHILVAYQGLHDHWTTLLVKESYHYTQKFAVMEYPDTIMGLMRDAIMQDIRENKDYYTKKTRYPLPTFFDSDELVAVFYTNNIAQMYEIVRRHTRIVFDNGYSMSVCGQPVQIRNGASQMFQELRNYKQDT